MRILDNINVYKLKPQSIEYFLCKANFIDKYKVVVMQQHHLETKIRISFDMVKSPKLQDKIELMT